MKNLKGVQIIGIGLIVLAIGAILRKFVSIPDVFYFAIMIFGIIIELIGMTKIKKEEGNKKK